MRRVFVSGCFDRLHPGHMEFFRFARSLGDHLTVSVGSDESIRLLKGRDPVFNQYERLAMVASLKTVDHALIPAYEGAGDCFAIVAAMRPDVWVINESDSNVEQKVSLAERYGIAVVFNPRPTGYHSTTQLTQTMEGLAP